VTTGLPSKVPSRENGGVSASPAPPIIGVDVGGTKVAAAVVNGRRAEHLIERPTDLTATRALIDGIGDAIMHVAHGQTPAAVGIGIPSQIDYASGRAMSSVNIPLEGVSLRDELGERIGGPVFVDNDANVAALENGSVSGRDVVALAREGDRDSLLLLERLAIDLGVGISNAVNIFEPELIVIGGGLSVATDLFLDRAVEEASTRALPTLWQRVRVDVAQAGAAAGVIGAGLLAHQEIERNVDTAGLTTGEGVR
jgi:predicted NBD/HSP70 family sugar kinase